MKILAVDDDEIILAILVEALKVVGFTDVQTSSGGAQAVDIISQADQPFDCFLLDIQMPGIDGIELCASIRETPGYEKTPIIMLTAMSERSYIDRAFTAGATDYITKPFDIIELGARVKNAERLTKEAKRSQENYTSLEAITRKLAEGNKITLDARIDVNDVPQFLAYHVFENYVAMLQRGKLYSSNLFSIRILNISTILNECTSDEFEYLIGSFSDAISDSLTTTGVFFTYAGSGNYVCIYNRLKDTIFDSFSTLVQDKIDQMGLVFNNGKVVDAAVQIGQTISPGIFSRPGKTEIIQQAIERSHRKKEARLNIRFS